MLFKDKIIITHISVYTVSTRSRVAVMSNAPQTPSVDDDEGSCLMYMYVHVGLFQAKVISP